MSKAEKLKQELEALRRPDGLIVCEDAVEWARENPESELHSHILWDEAKAAHQYRLWQVRQLITIYVRSEDGAPQVVSLSVDRAKPGGGYRDVQEVLKDDELRKVLVLDALMEFKRVRAKYEHVKELASVYVEIDKADKKYKRTASAVRAA